MMTDTLVGVSPPTSEPARSGERELTAAELAVVEGLVCQAGDQGIALTAPDGLLEALTHLVEEKS